MKQLKSMRRILAIISLPLMITFFSGCVYLVVGGLGALGGYVVSPDTVEGITAEDHTTVWDEAVKIVSIMGLIDEQNDGGGIIVSRINGTKVTINIVPMGASSTKLSVKARRAFFPRINVAQDVYIKIMSNLNE